VSSPRFATIEGHRVAVFERNPPIAPTLDLLLNGGRGPDGYLWRALRVAVQHPLRLGGTAMACDAFDHRLAPWIEGFAIGRDGIARSLSVQACLDCGAVCVRDRSYDSLTAYAPDRVGAKTAARRPPRRRDHVIGWYSGARRGQRVYT